MQNPPQDFSNDNYHWVLKELKEDAHYLSVFLLLLFGIHSTQDWTATTRHGVTRKEKDEKHIRKL